MAGEKLHAMIRRALADAELVSSPSVNYRNRMVYDIAAELNHELALPAVSIAADEAVRCCQDSSILTASFYRELTVRINLAADIQLTLMLQLPAKRAREATASEPTSEPRPEPLPRCSFCCSQPGAGACACYGEAELLRKVWADAAWTAERARLIAALMARVPKLRSVCCQLATGAAHSIA